MRKYWIAVFAATAGISTGIALCRETRKKQREARAEGKHIPYGVYEAVLKRRFDFFFALVAIILLSPVMFVTAVFVKKKLGRPVIFIQKRPGKDEKIFEMYKFRSMSDARGKGGVLLPDEERLGMFGKTLRATSMDELPELFNIIKGDMSVVGPRPQLVRDLVFMTKEQRRRHEVRQGLTGLAQVKGRNAIDWERKLELDLEYIKKITFAGDIKIIYKTLIKAFVKREGITDGDMATAYDYGDWLLKTEKVSQKEYEEKQCEAELILDMNL